MTMSRGQIWLADLSPTVGAEIAKIRPVLVISSDLVGVLPLKVIAPITGWQPAFVNFPWMVRIDPTSDNGLSKASSVDTFQIRSLSEVRFKKLLGILEDAFLLQVEKALVAVLEIRQ